MTGGRRWAIAFAAGLLLSAKSPQARFENVLSSSGVTYRNVSGEREKRFILSSLGNGVGLLDYDQDGDLDLYFVNGAYLDEKGAVRDVVPERNELYRNEGDFHFTNVTTRAGVENVGFGMGCAAGDFDNDGLPDLYVTNLGPNVLFRNRGDGTFEDVTSSAGVGDPGWGTSAAFFDAEPDGDLDLYVANYLDPEYLTDPKRLGGPCNWFGLAVFCGPSGLRGGRDVFYRNESNGKFTEASAESGLRDSVPSYGLGVVAGDYDGDGDSDLYVANDSQANLLFRNDGGGRFSEVGFFSGVAYSAEGRAQASMGVDLGDLDGDGRADLFVTNFSHDYNTFYRNYDNSLFVDATTESGLRMPSWFYLGWATRFADFDNDGDDDVFVANGHVYPEVDGADLKTTYRQRNQLFWNDGRGRFVEGDFPPEDAMSEVASSRGAAFGDLDEDGDVDWVLVRIDDAPSIVQNVTSGDTRWLQLRLVGTRSNRDGIGARIRITVGSRAQIKESHTSGSFLSSSDPRVHFGLGEETQADVLIRWPGGTERKLDRVHHGQIVTVIESEK